MAREEPAFIASDCPMAGHHIAQGPAVNELPAVPLRHPLTLVRMAYGID
jgi:glycerol-3-phosphate dehydrogenase subunit C